MSAPDIVKRIGKELGLKYIPNFPKECRAVKLMLDRGFSEDEIHSAYMKLKREPFWHDKFLSFMHLNKNIESMEQQSQEWDEDRLREFAKNEGL